MKNNKISLVINIIIVILAIMASVFMFTGFKFMPDEPLLQLTKMEMFKFYTLDSNILIGIVSLIFVIYENKLIKNKIKEIPKTVYLLKYIGTAGITLTFVVTAVFLSPQYGFYAMYNNSNLFFHLIIPLLAIITYLFYEGHNNKYSYAFLGIIPMFIYSLYYAGMILTHLNDGGLTFKYDFYGFLQGNINNIYIVVPVIYLFSYLISLALIFLNKKVNKKTV